MSGAAADLVLLIHVLFVAWVVIGLLLIVASRWTRWRWPRRPWVRLAHLASIAFVVAQTWRGQPCPLTIWENRLRVAAGEDAYAPDGFMATWLHAILFFEIPLQTFAWIYTGFALLVLASFVITPVQWHTAPKQGGHGR